MDEKKLRVYTTAVSIAGLSVFLLSLWEVYPYYLPGSSRGDIWSYSLMMVLLMVVCRMLPIYFAEDKTLEISFVPVLACAITGGAPLAVVLFGVSTLFTVMQNPATKHYYWPLAREPRKELFNTGNILVSISAGGLPLLLAGMPDNLASLPALGLSLLFAALCILVNLTLFILYYQVGGMGQFGTLMRQNIGGLLPNIIATVPLGLLLGVASFRGRGLLVVLNRTLMGMPPVVCGLIFYLFFSGVGPFRGAELLFTVEIMIIAQVVLITPIVAGSMETYASSVAPAVRENACGLGLGKGKTFALLLNECVYQVFSAYLLAFARAIAEVGAVSMVGGAIAWKTNVMTTAIMEYTNKGNFSKGIALGIILLALSFVVNIVLSLLQRRLSK